MWQSFDGGASLGQTGSEEGVIIRDEEYSDGARITVERDTRIAPFAITCGVYGLMVHTRFLGSEAEADREVDRMKPALADMTALEDLDHAASACAAFVERFPT